MNSQIKLNLPSYEGVKFRLDNCSEFQERLLQQTKQVFRVRVLWEYFQSFVHKEEAFLIITYFVSEQGSVVKRLEIKWRQLDCRGEVRLSLLDVIFA